MVCGRIYLVSCLPTGKVYVGQTTQRISERWESHLRGSEKHDYKFYRAIRKYGPENFTVEELASYSASTKQELKPLLDEAERKFIKQYNSRKKGYNSTDGGDGVLGYVWSDSQKEHMRRINLGKHLSEEHKAKIAKSGIGKHLGPLSEEHRRHISLGKIGRSLPSFSEEHKAKIRKAQMGHFVSEESKAKMRKPKVMSAEGRKVLSELKSKKVIQYNLKKEVVCVWPSIKSVYQFLGVSSTRMRAIISKGEIVCDSKFEYEGKTDSPRG